MKLIVFLALNFYCIFCFSDNIVVGISYDIIEKDLLNEIETRVKSVNWDELLNSSLKNWTALKPVEVPVAIEDRHRFYQPEYVNESIIKGADGKTLYPAGYTFNPLAYSFMLGRIVVTDEKYVPWLLKTNKLLTNDQILLSHGDPIALSISLNRPVYRLDAVTAMRLNVQFQPVIISQSSLVLQINEYAPEFP